MNTVDAHRKKLLRPEANNNAVPVGKAIKFNLARL